MPSCRRHGKATERRIADKLSIWWTGTPKAFIRSPCSGGWPRARANGDMVANMEDTKMPANVIEAARRFTDEWSMDVKRRVKGSRGGEKWSLEELLTAPKHPIIKWWLEIEELAKERETFRFLVANKATYHSYLILGEAETCFVKDQMVKARSYTPAIMTLRDQKLLGPYIELVGISPEVPETLTVFELNSFLTHVDSRALGGLGDGATEGSGAQEAP